MAKKGVAKKLIITDPIVPEVPEIKGNTKTLISPAIRWSLTWNNYTEEDIKWIQDIIKEACRFAIIAKEVGDEGTPHLQGYIEFRVKHRPFEVFKTTKIHWEKSNKTKLINVNYCSKQDKEPWIYPKNEVVYTIKQENMYDWQLEVLEWIDDAPDDRTVYWVIGSEGGEGKTSFQKYLAVHKSAFILGGKAADIRNAICDRYQKTGKTPELVCVNIPKSYNKDYLSYEGFENIKDACFYSGKYEGGMVVGNPPHLIIFSNEAPDTSKMSADRWSIWNIQNKKLEKYVEPDEEEEPEGV